jgi:hypothetical protein
MPLPASTTTGQRPDAGEVDERGEVRGVVAEDVPLLDGPLGPEWAGTPCSTRARISRRPESWPTGDAPGAAQLDPVVPGRVVAGGEHRAGAVEGAAGVVELVGRGEADAQDVGALARGAAREGRREPGEEGRMSWPTTTRVAPVTCTNAAPTSWASASSTCSGTSPRMS